VLETDRGRWNDVSHFTERVASHRLGKLLTRVSSEQEILKFRQYTFKYRMTKHLQVSAWT